MITWKRLVQFLGLKKLLSKILGGLKQSPPSEDVGSKGKRHVSGYRETSFLLGTVSYLGKCHQAG